MASTTNPCVLIVGAGLTGCTLAYALAREGSRAFCWSATRSRVG